MAGYTDLHLLSFYGGEKVNVPVVVSNPGNKAINGTVDIAFYLSQTLSPSGNPFSTKTNEPLSIGACKIKTLTIPVTIPSSNLTAGVKYYIIASVTSKNIAQVKAMASPLAFGQSYEYLGVPVNTGVFSSGLYFKFVKETIEGISAAKRKNPKVDVTDAMSFIETFEGDSTSPYLDSSNIPTIGVGINLTTLSPALETNLAAAVQAFYADPANHKTLDISNYSAQQVINMLIGQATGDKTNVASKQAFNSSQDQALFTQSYNEYAAKAQTPLSAVWGQLSPQAQIAIVDLVYNAGSVWPGVAAALNSAGGPDLLRAGFQLVDAKRTRQPNAPGLTIRAEAEYQNLLAGNLALLGNIVTR